MDVTPELIDIANNARREAMACVTIRKVELPGTSACWQIMELAAESVTGFGHGGISVESAKVRSFPYERAARNEFDRIIMRAILDAVANHLVKAQTPNPSQAA